MVRFVIRRLLLAVTTLFAISVITFLLFFAVPSSPATVNRYLSTLSVVCTYAREVLGAEVGPWQKKKHTLKEPTGQHRYLTKDVAGALLREIVPHARPLVFFDLLTGLRKGNRSGVWHFANNGRW